LESIIRRQVGAVLAADGTPPAIAPPEHGPPRQGDLRSNLLDASLAERVLGWTPGTSLEDGLRTTVAWFAARRA
jgi:nucleoside-diphosphate-sugar epimerase